MISTTSNRDVTPHVMSESLEGGATGTRYSVPGILHYLQHEFSNYELDKIRWEDERNSLKVFIMDAGGTRYRVTLALLCSNPPGTLLYISVGCSETGSNKANLALFSRYFHICLSLSLYFFISLFLYLSLFRSAFSYSIGKIRIIVSTFLFSAVVCGIDM